MSAPRFSAVTLRALARVQETRRALRSEAISTLAFSHVWLDHDDALKALWIALDADAVRAHPVPVGDEPDRDPSPHRFKMREIL